MDEIRSDAALVARCGLYCGACGAFLKGRCPGCAGNDKAAWCGIRSCCAARGYGSCAECGDHPDPSSCRLFNNLVSRIFGLLFRSDRAACISRIRRLGLRGHADLMARNRTHTIRRGRAE